MLYLLLNLVIKKTANKSMMKKSVIFMIFFIFLFSQCGLVKNKKPKEEVIPVPEVIKTPEQILAEEKLRLDSIENAAFEQAQKIAFGDLQFGMEKNEVETKNEKRQLLGKYNYNFSYAFNNEDQLFKVKIKSDGIKAIQFDTNLKSNFQNLSEILKTKLGEPEKTRNYPSVFDVQNSKKMQMSHWEMGTKQINLGLQENGMNSFSVICDISDRNMDEAETLRLKNLQNKDIIEAAGKF